MSKYDSFKLGLEDEGILKKSLSGYGAETLEGQKGTKSTSKVKHNRKKINIIKMIQHWIIILVVLITMVFGGNYAVDKISRDRALDNAIEYMSSRLVSYLERADVNYTINKDKTITILDDDREKMKDLCEQMENDGFTTHGAYYVVSEVCGEEGFNKIVQEGGYKSGYDFLINNYFIGSYSSDGDTCYFKLPAPRKFENGVESNVVGTVEGLYGKPSKDVGERTLN